MPKLVIVESPAKAKTISKYLGRGYKVTASMGHVRDLRPRDNERIKAVPKLKAYRPSAGIWPTFWAWTPPPPTA